MQNLWLSSLSKKMEMIAKHIISNDYVGRKIKIMFEQLQFESGLSQNIFQASKTRARQIVSESVLTYLANQLAPLGISIYIDAVLPKGPTLMDKVLDSTMEMVQIQIINKVRLHMHYLY